MPAKKTVTTALTMEDLAQLAGVSKITVSRALRDSPLVTLETREKIRALAEKNLRVPENVSVIGYDDTPGAASFVPPLTSVHQYLRDGGVLLAKKMLGLIEGQPVTSEMLPTTLMVRQT